MRDMSGFSLYKQNYEQPSYHKVYHLYHLALAGGNICHLTLTGGNIYHHALT